MGNCKNKKKTSYSIMSSVLRFFFTLQDPNLRDALFLSDELRVALTWHHRAVLVGPRHCGKTSMLWTFAQSIAAEGHRSLVLCVKQLVEAKGGAPLVQSKSNPLWSNVDIKYVATVQEAVAALLAVHLLPEVPRFLCVDDLDEIVRTSSADALSDVALLLATLEDARKYCTMQMTRLASGDSERACAALVSGCAERLPLPSQEWSPVFHHWGFAPLLISRPPTQQPGGKQFRMAVADCTVIYSVADGMLAIVTAVDSNT